MKGIPEATIFSRVKQTRESAKREGKGMSEGHRKRSGLAIQRCKQLRIERALTEKRGQDFLILARVLRIEKCGHVSVIKSCTYRDISWFEVFFIFFFW